MAQRLLDRSEYRKRNFAAGEVDVLSAQLREFPSDAAPQQPNII
jgi:hypothetical protein